MFASVSHAAGNAEPLTERPGGNVNKVKPRIHQ